MTPIMNAEQVAALLGCSKRTVEEHARDGTLPGAKFGDGWVFAADLVVDAVKRISLERNKPTRNPAPRAVKVSEPSRRKPPGMAHLSEQAIREILGAQ